LPRISPFLRFESLPHRVHGITQSYNLLCLVAMPKKLARRIATVLQEANKTARK